MRACDYAYIIGLIMAAALAEGFGKRGLSRCENGSVLHDLMWLVGGSAAQGMHRFYYRCSKRTSIFNLSISWLAILFCLQHRSSVKFQTVSWPVPKALFKTMKNSSQIPASEHIQFRVSHGLITVFWTLDESIIIILSATARQFSLSLIGYLREKKGLI